MQWRTGSWCAFLKLCLCCHKLESSACDIVSSKFSEYRLFVEDVRRSGEVTATQRIPIVSLSIYWLELNSSVRLCLLRVSFCFEITPRTEENRPFRPFVSDGRAIYFDLVDFLTWPRLPYAGPSVGTSEGRAAVKLNRVENIRSPLYIVSTCENTDIILFIKSASMVRNGQRWMFADLIASSWEDILRKNSYFSLKQAYGMWLLDTGWLETTAIRFICIKV